MGRKQETTLSRQELKVDLSEGRRPEWAPGAEGKRRGWKSYQQTLSASQFTKDESVTKIGQQFTGLLSSI